MAHDILRQYLEYKFPDTKVERTLSPNFRTQQGELLKMTPLFFNHSCIGFYTFYNDVVYFFETPEVIKLESSLG